MQEETFKDELTFLKDASKDKNKVVPSLVKDLNLFLDSYGLIRSKGRISKTLYFSDEVKNPLLLAKNHPLTKLITKDAHERCKHLGMPTTISFLRNAGYWVPKARQVTRSILNSCTICKKYNSLCYKYPPKPDLPKHRVNLIRPFFHTGVDYTGHLWVEDPDTKQRSKMYILIFTCTCIRAVHVE